VQPAPLMTNAPKPKSANILRSGRDPGAAHIAMLQPHGQNSNQEPVTITTDGNSTEYWKHRSDKQRTARFLTNYPNKQVMFEQTK
jgi:hypothetical protein